MSDTELYLKQNVVLEPLVDQWYAWPHLISPATAARNIENRHLKIMESYVTSPESHAEAVKNPMLSGGPFMDYSSNRAQEVQLLAERTQQRCASLIELSKAITELDQLLKTEALGFSMEPLYAKIPECLRGFVELVYDLNNHPSFRFIEPLLYRSKYYDRSLQSIALSTISSDDRPFILSTPRMLNDDSLQLPLSFDDPAIDALSRMKTHPMSYSEIREKLHLEEKHEPAFKKFLTDHRPAPYKKFEGQTARWRYFGHACVLLEARNCNLLVDPVLSYTYDSKISRYTYEDLPDMIDYVLITHDHQDHILFETLLQLRHKIKTVIVPRSNNGSLQDPSLKLILRACGFKNVIEISEMEEFTFENGGITAIPFLGEHSDLNIGTKMAYLCRIDNYSMLFAADSCNISSGLYEHVHDAVGDVDVLFLGMECDGAPLSWLYGPLLTQRLDRRMDQSRRLAGSNFERAMDMVQRFNFKEVYVYAMGQEPWLNYIMSIKYTENSNPIIQSNKLLEACASRGITAERLFGEKEFLLR